MSLSLAVVMGLAQQCAPGIALEALVPQVQVESHFNELAIGVKGHSTYARSVPEATAIATRYIQMGLNVDLGLAQINHHNLRRLGMSVSDAFDPCTSLRAASIILSENWQTANASYSGTDAINATWSLYNSGSTSRGIRNGYVGKIWKAANDLVPQMQAMMGSGQIPPVDLAQADAPQAPSDSEEAAPAPPAAPPPQPRWVYGTPDTGALVFK